MKNLLLLCLSLLIFQSSFAQAYQNISLTDRKDIRLSDSVIYFDNKPVAYYYLTLDESNPHYNIHIKSLSMNLLIDAQIIKFDAPVAELKPFYYYNLVFKNERDTFAVYHYGQAFIVELAILLKDYRLLDGNRISRSSLGRFKRGYTGNVSLMAKIREYVTYLNESRYFNEQTTRDRTKPVTIINDRVIMQDGKKIGLLIPVSDEVLLPSDRVVDASKINIGPKNRKSKLYQVSVPSNKEDRNDELLLKICQYIENYLL